MKKCSNFVAAMKNRIFFVLLCLIGMSMYSVPAFSWGQEGHRVIAKIAYDNLTPKARKSVDKILGKRGMIYWSNWADEIKSDNIYPQSIKDGWHYQNLASGLSDSAIVAMVMDCPKVNGRLFSVHDSLVYNMAAERVYDSNRDHTLRFIVHLSGDLYCPMHMGRKEDQGGNLIPMEWFGKPTNLHEVWDDKLIESQGYSYSEYAQIIEDTYAPLKREIEQRSEAQLLLDNYHFTESIYAYQQVWDGNTYHYIYTWHELMEKQLYVAGIRLAKLLNEMFQ